MLEVTGLVEGYSFWTFTDIFEENYFPSLPFHGGFGLLNLHGIPKPTYRAFELLHRLGTEAVPVTGGTRPWTPGWCGGRDAVTVLLTNHALPRHPIETRAGPRSADGLLPPRDVYVERIDEEHANAKRLWLEMGKPESPTRGRWTTVRGLPNGARAATLEV